jgi:cell division protease FtsH
MYKKNFLLPSVSRTPSLRNIRVRVQADVSIIPPFFSHLFDQKELVYSQTNSPVQKLASAPNLRFQEEDWVYSDFAKAVKDDKISSVYINANNLKTTVISKVGDTGYVQLLPNESIIQDMLQHNVEIHYLREQPKEDGFDLRIAFQFFFQMVAFFFLFQFIASIMGGGGMKNSPFEFTKNIGKQFNSEEHIVTTFKDVAGVEQAKEDLQEVIDFLKNTDVYTKVGARIPKGVLLIGPPGTGKTLMARAVAGEAGVPFFSCSASEFIEMFVGVGASRIRELFKKAKEQAPCIIFIDEIDAVGKKRSGTMGVGNDERDQTINQLLTEMDGFSNNNGVIVMAATNRPELLDDALTRPGRFDRRVTVDLPNNAGRLEILSLYLSKKPIDATVDVHKLAAMTIGFSGAELENLCNEAAIYTARLKKDAISQQIFEYMFDKLTLGAESKSNLVTESKKKIIAYHEAGHTLLGVLMGDFDILRKVSIVARGNAGGITFFEPSEERIDMGLYTREYLENQLIVLLGGRVAEEMTFGTLKITTGASNDLERATDIATQMVTQFGFNETIGPLSLSQDEMLYNSISAEVTSEVKYIIDNAYQIARDLLQENEYYLIKIAKTLMEKETLDRDEVLGLLDGMTCKLVNSRELREKTKEIQPQERDLDDLLEELLS